VAVPVRDQQDLPDRGDPAVVGELDAAIVAAVKGETTSTIRLGSAMAREPRSAGAQVTTRSADTTCRRDPEA